MIIRRSLTPLNYSRTLRPSVDVRRSAAVTTTRAANAECSWGQLGRMWLRCPAMPEGVADPEQSSLEQIRALASASNCYVFVYGPQITFFTTSLTMSVSTLLVPVTNSPPAFAASFLNRRAASSVLGVSRVMSSMLAFKSTFSAEDRSSASSTSSFAALIRTSVQSTVLPHDPQNAGTSKSPYQWSYRPGILALHPGHAVIEGWPHFSQTPCCGLGDRGTRHSPHGHSGKSGQRRIVLAAYAVAPSKSLQYSPSNSCG